MIPRIQGQNITIDAAMEMNPDLKEAYENEEDTKRLIDTSKRLEGLPRHSYFLYRAPNDRQCPQAKKVHFQQPQLFQKPRRILRIDLPVIRTQRPKKF